MRLRSFEDMTWKYFKSLSMAFFLMTTVCYVAYPFLTSLVILLSSSSCAFLLLLLKEFGMRKLLVAVRRAGYNMRNVMLVGDDEAMIHEIRQRTETDHWLGIKAVGVLTLKHDNRREIASLRNLGKLDSLITIIEEQVIDCVMFVNHSVDNEVIKESIWHCEQRGIEIWLKVNLLESKISKVAVEHLENVPFLNFRSGPQNTSALVVKYALDKIVSLFAIFLLMPLMLIISGLIKLTSPGPIFFKEYRASINGRKFVCYKFRSMITNAEQLKDSLRDKNEMTGPVFKIKDDPRITPFGKFLRKTSLDELPQLWNVLKGEMSLVGPRALPVREAAQIRGWQRRRLSMKPGITCIWQVEGRNKITDFDEWSKLDLHYIDHWSLWLDFKLLFKTVPAVLRVTGV